jgi:two-component system response regulator CpxR
MMCGKRASRADTVMENKTILCIDDDHMYCDLYRSIFEGKGYAVETARDAVEGLAAALAAPPAAVILDVMMPERNEIKDGFDLLARLRADERTKHVPVAMVSSLGDPDDKAHGMRLGASTYISKFDTDPTQLLRDIEQLMGGAASALAAPADAQPAPKPAERKAPAKPRAKKVK